MTGLRWICLFHANDILTDNVSLLTLNRITLLSKCSSKIANVVILMENCRKVEALIDAKVTLRAGAVGGFLGFPETPFGLD